MKKKSQKQHGKKRNPQAKVGTAVDQQDRLGTLSRRALIALPVVAAVGYYSVVAVQAKMHEGDLTRIGEGKPSIVQIHDPQCPLCQTLQRQTKKAMKSFDRETFTYLVANVRTPEGSAFSVKYGVPHVTLLLFDHQGEMVQIIRGPSDVESLKEIFSVHLESYS